MSSDAGHEFDEAGKRLGARSELKQSAVWAVLGLAILVTSLRMDRLQSQNINPHTVPGLLPALLGIVMLLLAGLLALRSWRRGAGTAHASPPPGFDATAARREALVIALCLMFGVGMVGHGLPFWLSATLFIGTAGASLQPRPFGGRGLALRTVATAAAVGLCAGGAITLVFQQIFLVRLP